MIGVAVLILVTVNQRMLMLELQRSQLLGSVSHELRNQLTGVMGMIDLALDKNIVPSQEEVRDLIVLARREAADATGIIEDLLTASRMESNVLDVATEPVDLDQEVAVFEELIGSDYPTMAVSTVTGEGLDGLGPFLFERLGVVRVYTKPPGGKPEIMRAGACAAKDPLACTTSPPTMVSTDSMRPISATGTVGSDRSIGVRISIGARLSKRSPP